MAYKLQIEADIKGIGNISYVDAPFNKAIRLLDAAGQDMISLKQLAKARIIAGEKDIILKDGSYVKQGVLNVPERIAGRASKVLLPKSFVMEDFESVEYAVRAHKRGKEAQFLARHYANNIVELAKKGKEGYFFLEGTRHVPTDRFGEDELTVWCFGKAAQEYGMLLKNLQQTRDTALMSFIFYAADYINAQPEPFINQLWLADAYAFGSCVDGIARNLSLCNRVRGVPVKNPDKTHTTKPAIGAYTADQMAAKVKKALHSEGITGDLEKRIISGLGLKR